MRVVSSPTGAKVTVMSVSVLPAAVAAAPSPPLEAEDEPARRVDLERWCRVVVGMPPLLDVLGACPKVEHRFGRRIEEALEDERLVLGRAVAGAEVAGLGLHFDHVDLRCHFLRGTADVRVVLAGVGASAAAFRFASILSMRSKRPVQNGS